MSNKLIGLLLLCSLLALDGCKTSIASDGCKNGLLIPKVNIKPRFPIQEFVSFDFVEKWPVLEATRYGSDAKARSASVKSLQVLLADPAKRSSWGHILATLGLMGGVEALDGITSFLQSKDGSSSVHEQRAVHSGLMALGTWSWISKHRQDLAVDARKLREVILSLIFYTIKSGNFSGFPYSHDAQHLNFGRKGTRTVNFPVPTDAVLKQEFALAAVWGLALSGDAEAGRAFEILAKAKGDLAVKRFLLAEAQRGHRKITEEGLLCFYDRNSFECQQMLSRHTVQAKKSAEKYC